MAKKEFSPKERLLILDEVKKGGAKVNAVCKKWQISRFTFYRWAKNWKKPQNLRRVNLLRTRRLNGKFHPKAIKGKREKLILECVLKNPGWSSHKIEKFLREYLNGAFKVSNHGIANVLNRYGLNTEEARFEYSRKHLTRSIFPNKFTDFEKYKIIEEYLIKGRKIAQICRQFHISRFTFYAWLKKYEQERTVSSLADARLRGESHPRYVGEAVKQKVLDVVAANPAYSVHKIHAHLAQEVGHHAIQNILAREDLNTFYKRQLFAQGYITTPKTKVSPLYEPVIPIYRLRQLIAPFTTIPKLIKEKPLKGIFALLASFAPLFIFYFFIKLLIFAPAGQSKVGIFFATVSLNFGIIFFLYSLKYYLSIVMVLKMANSGGADTQKQKVTNKFSRIIDRFLYQKRAINPLLLNFEKVTLEKKPFVSIHVAVYNEKNVIERLISAVTAQAWENYEVIICDDSTDETTEIAKESLITGGWVLYSSSEERSDESRSIDKESSRLCSNNNDEEVFLFTKPSAPTVTLIHRVARSGFKGGALQSALEVTDPVAEYVVVFDADFVPYPDTIEQFVKAFQVLGGNQGQSREIKDNQGLENPNNPSSTVINPANPGSRIAAVQGYQWHVLNKSENWITRGVRTEYAGSYVIERSGEEIYGGLKQIAGSVYAIRADILRQFGWGKSITEDFELTLRLYEAGYKVAFTPYIQAPAEAVSTIKRLIRQRMRWAEGASFNIKVMLARILKSRNLTGAEKFEFAYLAPYYLQAAFFVVGTLSWFISEAVFHSPLPFWTSAFGWSLVFTNLLSLPLMNIIGLFLEESDERDYFGVLSFIALSYIVVPFQAYAAVKGFMEQSEGPWFRTPKTGLITDVFDRSKFAKFFGNIFGKPSVVHANDMRMETSRMDANERTLAHSFRFADIGINSRIPIKPRHIRWLGNLALSLVIATTVAMSLFAPFIPQATSYASQPALRTVANLEETNGPKEPEEPKDKKNPQNKDEILRNAISQEITTPRAISKTTKGGKNLEFIFHREPRVRIKLENQEIEFETKTVFGQKVNPQKSKIYSDKEVVYEEVVKDIDLKYSITNDLIAEEVILKSREAIISNQFNNLTIEQSIKTIDVKVVSPDPTVFGFYSEDGKELFSLSQPFAKDAKGEVSNDLSFTLDKEAIGYRLTKSMGEGAKQWLFDPNRVYPVSIDPSVVVSGGIAEEEVQFGGLQRKVAFVNGNWYAFYNDGTDVLAKKSSDGSTWTVLGNGSSDLDSTDADNYNPSIAVSANTIIVFWVDDGANLAEGRTINTASADALGTLCQLGTEATADPSFMVTVAAVSTSEAVVAISDFDAVAADFGVYNPDTLGGTCSSNTADKATGNITFGSGLTAQDRPVVTYVTGNYVDMVFQDGTNLLYSRYDASANEWTRNKLVIAAVTDNIYSVTTDGTTIWILTVSGTTATNFYSCCTDDFAETQLDSDAGANDQDISSDIDMFCVTSTDCKIVYTDDIDVGGGGGPDLVFIDCDDETCSGPPTPTVLDSDIGTSGDVANPAIYCVATDNCKIVYGEYPIANSPDQVFLDCTSANQECTTSSATILNSDIGSATTLPTASIDCTGSDTDCKVVYWEDDVDIVHFVDCSAADCSTTDADTTLDDNASGDVREYNSISCAVAATDCKVVFHDTVDQDLTFIDCSDGSCASPAQVDVSANVGFANAVPNDIWCPAADATDCKIVYRDESTNSVVFTDCGAVDCSSKTETAVVSIVFGSTRGGSASLNCVSVTDCKFVHDDGNSSNLYFVDCDAAACDSGSVIYLPGPRAKGAIQCLTSVNCKFAYYDGTAATDPTVQFADCDVTNCFPSLNGTTVTISADFDGRYSSFNNTCFDDETELYVGIGDASDIFRTYLNFPLTSLPSGSSVIDVDLKINVDLIYTGSGATADIQAYNQDGLTNPSSDTCANRNTRSANDASPYRNNITDLQSTGVKTLDLGTAADADVQNANAQAGDLFSVALNENGTTGNNSSRLEASENAGSDEPKLVITYTPAPWSSQTNVTSVSITYDSTNVDLYAHIIKDTDEKAYFKSTDATTISWGAEGDYGWSGIGDHLGHISAPEKAAGTSQIGVVLRESLNFEFAVVPEKTLFLLVAAPFLPKVFGRLRKRRRRKLLH